MNDPPPFAISGSTGLVGSALIDSLSADEIPALRLVRGERSPAPNEALWEPKAGKVDAARLEGVEVIVHLAGKHIAGERWTPQVKQQIVDSRVNSTRLLAETIASMDRKPRVFVCASATGYYGNRGDEPVDETSPAGEGFLAETCQQWEAACQPAWEAGVRVVQLRIGIVLSPKGGALEKMLPLFRWGGGGVLGSGDQVMSWIALPDLVRAIRFVAGNDAVHGAVNATAPQPVSNREFTKTLGAKLGRPTWAPAPAFALKLAMGEMAEPLLLHGSRVLPHRLEEAGFRFETPDLGSALDQVLGKGR
ncbi:TIGR01777 family oxidoreductase [Botrimarina hoheduenensis]|uniref:Epimerase family protein n=1 Tax=Botrimarina hoheduenensis TaxID=2528000 RepID=A0A5C5W7N1_9BACT|nr:TIGR01777 family oxidoreductase [Botrimarina hoheduenensis]TWT46700.1 Epimerase family protein [Botrimarina hoheduenensis]